MCCWDVHYGIGSKLILLCHVLQQFGMKGGNGFNNVSGQVASHKLSERGEEGRRKEGKGKQGRCGS